jgi:hypothetical protein
MATPEGENVMAKNLPSLSEIDRKDKMIMWLGGEVLEQGEYNLDQFYTLLESHFALVSTWRELK